MAEQDPYVEQYMEQVYARTDMLYGDYEAGLQQVFDRTSLELDIANAYYGLPPNPTVGEDDKPWAGPWNFNERNWQWQRPYLSDPNELGLMFRSMHFEPEWRPGPLEHVQDLSVPCAALHSHPEHPHSLPDELEGKWIGTNPAWPETSLNYYLNGRGLTAEYPGQQEIFDKFVATVAHVLPIPESAEVQ